MNGGGGAGTVSSFMGTGYRGSTGEKEKPAGGKCDSLYTLAAAGSKSGIGNNKTGRQLNASVKLRNRVAVAAAVVFSAFGYAHATSLFAVGSARKYWPYPGGKNMSFSTDRYLRSSLAGLRGISVIADGITFFQSAGDTVLHAVSDLSLRKRRIKAQALLAEYSSETRRGQATGGNDQQAVSTELAELCGDHRYSDLYRSSGQVVCDRLIEINSFLMSMSRFFQSAIQFQSLFSQLSRLPFEGLCFSLSCMSCMQTWVKAAADVSALNNLASAAAATRDPLLQALSGQIKQERSLAARKKVFSAGFKTASLGARAVIPVSCLAVTPFGIVLDMGMELFDVLHMKNLEEQRNKDYEIPEDGTLLESLARENIGVAERAFLRRLRHAQGHHLQESITFLRHLGVSDTMIQKLQLVPEDMALRTLQELLYNDKLNFKGLSLGQTAESLSHIMGVSALGKRIKSGSLWLKENLSGHNGYSLAAKCDRSLYERLEE